MPIPTMDDAYRQMEERFRAQTGATTVAIEYYPAVLQAATSKASAESMAAAITALTNGVTELHRAQTEFTHASNTAASEMSKWSKDTATWTRRLTVATWALFAIAGVQAMAGIAQVVVALSKQ